MSVTVVGSGALRYFKDGEWRDVGEQKVAATGGTESDITVDGVDYRVHTFTSSGDLVVTAGGVVDVLLVAGGGGGCFNAGGGGGGGGFLETQAIVAIGTANVVVGAGGTPSVDNNTLPTKGGPSSFGDLTVEGGGVGTGVFTSRNVGLSGGCGAGGLGSSNNTLKASPSGNVASQGFDGGSGSLTLTVASMAGGGGGGGGGVGGNGVIGGPAGNGGVGKSSSITGTEVGYAGGGGGGARSGGATPGTATDGGGQGTANDNANSNGTDGLGGGGGGHTVSAGTSGNGGDGIVIIRYRL